MPKPQLIIGRVVAVAGQDYPAGENAETHEAFPAGTKYRAWISQAEGTPDAMIVVSPEQATTLRALKEKGQDAQIVAHEWERTTRGGGAYEELKASSVEPA